MRSAMSRQERPGLLSRLRGEERGDVASSMILLLVVMFTFLAAVHVGLIFHARNVAQAAAQDALRAAALEGALAGNGVQAAERTLDLFDGITAAQVDVDKSDEEVIVRVTGQVETPLGGPFTHFEISLNGPTEQYWDEQERIDNDAS